MHIYNSVRTYITVFNATNMYCNLSYKMSKISPPEFKQFTSRFSSATSDLLAASTMGTRLVPLTRRICSRMSLMSWKLCRLVRLNTMMNPWPFLMYRSRMEANCSVPAVSKISRIAGSPSTSISLR